MKSSIKKILTGLFVSCLIIMLWAYHEGYDSSIDWEVTTTGEIIQYPIWTFETNLATHEISGEKYLLSENYSGSEIKRDINVDQAFLAMIWLGLCLFLAGTTYLKRYAFFAVVALFAIFLNRLNLYEIGLFGIQSKIVILIPFVAFILPMVIFHEYKKTTSIWLRLVVFLAVSGLLLIGVSNAALFTDHVIAHSLFGFTICGLLFLFLVSEEIIFSILYVVTSGKGGTSNHIHFLLLSLIYLGNLVLYYLNKSGLFTNNFFFFDPFVLLAISSIISLWSLRFKNNLLHKYVSNDILFLLTFSLSIITLLFLGYHMIRGNDALYQAFHYFILYFHIGFGVLFFFYIILNFIDPLIKGFEIHKIVYKERNFPYLSARLGGFMAVLAFYFLAGQEPYNLLRSGYYNYLAQEAKTEGNQLLSKEYTLQASYLGYNTHYSNYSLGWGELKKGAEFPSKTYFFSAAQRFPSSYALINYGNLDSKINPNKVQAIYEEALRKISSGEIENNLGVIHLEKGEIEKALHYFENAKQSDDWNHAPLINKWNVLSKIGSIDSSRLESDYEYGNFGVKSNILTLENTNTDLVFIPEEIEQAGALHRQAYLLNAMHLFDHDSINDLVRKEIDKSSDATLNSRMRKALAIHLYRKGEINEAFLALDYLQANAHQFYKGEYLDALGKLSLHQNANRLALEYFDKALELKYKEAIYGKIEALARLGRKNEVPSLLLAHLKKNPELTNQVNIILERLEKYTKQFIDASEIPPLDSLSDQQLVKLGRKNAFHEEQVIAIVDELSKREASGGYELLVDATEINPYSAKLLKKYAFVALDWNLVEYADQTLEKIKNLVSENDFQTFLIAYEEKKKAMEAETW